VATAKALRASKKSPPSEKCSHRIIFLHWNEAEGAERAATLRQHGVETLLLSPKPGETLRALNEAKPEALLIDHTRSASRSREVAEHLMKRRATRDLPLIFVYDPADAATNSRSGATPDKRERTQKQLPSAHFCTYGELPDKLETFLNTPASLVKVVPHEQAPLARKMGIKEGKRVSILDSPDGFVDQFSEFDVSEEFRRDTDHAIIFANTMDQLEHRVFQAERYLSASGGIGIVWRKKASGQHSEVSGSAIRPWAIDLGWIDYKIFSVDATWSGMLFGRSRKARKGS
jgi:hypothetical protein